MDKKSLMKDIGFKLRKIRESLRYKPTEMGGYLGVDKTTYFRNENGESPPRLMSLYRLSSKFDISLDWLIRGIEPMYCREKKVKKEADPPPPPPDPLESLPGDTRELVEYMERFPAVRYKIMLYFLDLKEKYKDSKEPGPVEKE